MQIKDKIKTREENSMTKKYLSIAMLVLLGSGVIGVAHATIIDFEAPLPGGLSPMTYISGNPVPNSAVITDQYANLGIVFQNVALVNLGYGHAPSGVNGLGNIDSNGNLDYGTPMTFTFVSPLDGITTGVTDYFSVTTDNWGWGGNTIILSAFAVDGTMIGSTSYTEGAGGVSPQLQNLGLFHTVVVDWNYNGTSGIGLDLLTFGDVSASPVPEPGTIALLGLGLIGLGGIRKKFKSCNS